MSTTLTNIYDLPPAIVEAVTRDPYVGGGDITATKLIDAPQVRRLAAQHRDALTVDVSERIWSLLGQAVHTILERAGLREQGMVIEERLFADVLGWSVSGQVDRMHMDAGTITDYKVTTVYKRHGSDSWTRQLNVLRWLAVQNGHDVHTLEVVAIFRDWRKTDADRDPAYPRAAVARIPVPVWPIEEAAEYIMERVALHQAAWRGVDVPCTDEERWYSGTTWAVQKPGAKRALRVVDDPATADVLPGYVLVERPGVYKRCQHYCEVRAVCPQWAATGMATSPETEDEA